MRRRLGIVTSSREVGLEYVRQIRSALGDGFDMISYSFEANNINTISKIDALVFSTISQYEILKKHLSDDIEIIICKLTISKEGYELIKRTPILGSAMLVNLSFEMCIETIATLQQLGVEGIELVPVYPNMNSIPDLKVAVTTGEKGLVPPGVEQIIDLGHRKIDKNTILEIAVAMQMENVLSGTRVADYFEHLASYNHGVEFLISKSNHIIRHFKTLLSIMDKGVLSINGKGIIENCNQVARSMVGENKSLLGIKAEDLFPQMDINRYLSSPKPVLNQLINVNGNMLTVSFVPVKGLEDFEVDALDGVYMLLESFESEEDKQNMLRLQLANRGHIAKYNVDHIIGKSKAVEDVRKLIIRMGNSQSAVLITGESGTGKELTAQAIHNASPFKDKQFVAINCAAISSNLLESELFGYEAGAFTGASKGGKSGILELAHNGTLFLDEIGEMPLELQAKLLRVIQEKEVMRVGGNKIIKVNFRVIAATNKNLLKEVERGTFRQDLFYRLNVLPLHIPALRERVEDITVLIESIKSKEGYHFLLSDEVIAFFKAYDWKGNIRELKNCIEFFDNIGKAIISMEDLPHYMDDVQGSYYIPMQRPVEGELNDKCREDGNDEIVDALTDHESFVLTLLYDSFLRRKRLGRRSISEKAFEVGLYLSEYDIRAIMNTLKDKALISVSSGRGGSTISPKGIEWIRACQ
ncbi:sigma-54 interaction domain-containing protein [Fusibacter ferrireducens]|uniref:Sigma 54-interacting transcriptional regulator n=1 Tax=Fusibacter ferrireducens TaxID=2785058 RepID=A0ABR9ZSL4_9FIRM|nr:sigma 54-interacting transcriptional regulator [Fusibacter ferrireducens]MBF4693460.1 sigma 54-interacting transcriptional regulator [Fusibacter ferrireducens]